MNKLLTDVIIKLVSKHAKAQDYGVSIINIPDFDYVRLSTEIESDRSVELFFLGFSESAKKQLKSELPVMNNIKYNYSVEEAEESRNNGNESIFRILIFKRTEIEKISSLRHFPEITLEMVYKSSCKYCKESLSNINTVIAALIDALQSKTIRNILSFERVIAYLEELLLADEQEIPRLMKSSYYKLGLCSDKAIDVNAPNSNELVKRIKQNHKIIERISNLEQAERQSITNYYANSSVNQDIPRLILSFYKSKDNELLKMMDLEDVERCLRAAKEKNNSSPRRKGHTSIIRPTALAAQLVFDDDYEKIDELINKIKNEVDNRPDSNKGTIADVDYDGVKMQFKVEPMTEKVAQSLSTEDYLGGIIYADVHSPSEAIRDSEKYGFAAFSNDYLKNVWKYLERIGELIADGESIGKCLKDFLNARNKIIKYRNRLQDVPMLQVLSKHSDFSLYLSCYEKLLNAINEDFSKIWSLAPSNAKEIVNVIMSLDYVYIIGEGKKHAIPTPLHPLYLWKYIELSKEILASKGIDKIEDNSLSEDDKNFIIRKAEDIPDPLSVTLMPATLTNDMAVFLPLAGRIGTLPIYSNEPQINQSESGLDTLKQAIIRYLCLYPHAGIMFRICIIDPPSVEMVVSMLKALNNDRDFNMRINGIDISIYRTKEIPYDWLEIEDTSLNEGMLGKYKGKSSFNFNFKIYQNRQPYSQILSKISAEQHMTVIFDPNEVRVEHAQNEKQLHIHPLCVPKIYKYNPINDDIQIRPANEGGIFSAYSSIIEKLNEQPSSFSHTSTYFNTPLKRETYEGFLKKNDWLVILDQSLKSWDISLRAASEKLFYKENDYRSVGIYSSNCRKFILGYSTLVKSLGNYIPTDNGLRSVIQTIREVNDDGLISIVSHTSNKIFDSNHGKGSLGIAIAANHYKKQQPNSLLVGLDTQLAQEWLSEREDGRLPDLIGIRLDSESDIIIDIIEVKTHSHNVNSFVVSNGKISGHAVEQASILESLIYEMFGKTEKITTVSRKEILRVQVFEGLFQAELTSLEKHKYTELLNSLFAGEYNINVNKVIAFVDFENPISCEEIYYGIDKYSDSKYTLITIGSTEIQTILSNSSFEQVVKCSNNLNDDKEELNGTVATSQLTQDDLRNNELLKDKNSINETNSLNTQNVEEKCIRLNKVLRDYGINAYPINPDLVQEASRFTRFAVELKSGETVRSLEKSKNDIGIQLEANGEILVDHIKGTKYVSVDVPFAVSAKTIRLIDYLYLLEEKSGSLDIIAGQKANGEFEILDISKAPHLLVAGTTGSGKTIFLYTIIVSLLKQYSLNEIDFLIIDPKQTDFAFFDDLPNLYGGHVITDTEEALEMIKSINENDKEERIRMIKSSKSRDIESYNEKNINNKMKRLVIIIDEYADLIQTAELHGNRKDFERLLSMLAQKVRSLGIHLIIATQRPSANIVTGVLKANIPYRISFRLPSHTDSQTILDMSGAENLLGKGDMLLVTDSDTKRLQGLFITESELQEFIDSLL